MSLYIFLCAPLGVFTCESELVSVTYLTASSSSVCLCLFSITVTYMLAARGGLQVEVYWSARQHGDGSNFRLDSNSLTVMPSLFVKNRIPAFVFYGLISKRSLGCQRQSLRHVALILRQNTFWVFECLCAQETHPLILMNRPYHRITFIRCLISHPTTSVMEIPLSCPIKSSLLASDTEIYLLSIRQELSLYDRVIPCGNSQYQGTVYMVPLRFCWKA